MASQALYLKWRPQRFEDVVGQEHVTTTLKNALSTSRIAHAYLFTGPRGTGKTTMARLLAKAVNCLDEDVHNRPCNHCHICLAINEGRLLDLIEMDAASNTGVDNVREAIREKVGFRPNEARYKVYVIDEVHMLSTSAFNALLKTLEEPPEHVIFVLATTEPHKILPTIISRCQRFDFKRISSPVLVSRLQHIAAEEGVQVEAEALHLIARLSTGCARDAISLLDQLTAYGDEVITTERVKNVLGLGDQQTIFELVSHLADHQVGPGLSAIYRAIEQGVDARQFAQQIIDYLRSLLLLRTMGAASGDEAGMQDLDAQTRADMQALTRQFTAGDLVRAIKLFNQAQLDLRGSDQNQIALELAFVEAALEETNPATAPLPQPAVRVASPAVTQAAAPLVQSATPVAASLTAAAPPTASQEQRPAAPSRSALLKPDDKAQPEAEGPILTASETAEPGAQTPGPAAAITPEEINQHWAQIRQLIEQQSKATQSLINSAQSREVENGNCLVFKFPSARNRPGYNFSATQLDKENNKRIIEQALVAVLGRPCRVRIAVDDGVHQQDASAPSNQPIREESPPFESRPVAPARTIEHVAQPAPAMAPAAAPTGTPQESVPASSPSLAKSEPVSIEPAHPADIRQEALADPVVQELIRLGGQVTDIEEL